MVKKELMRRNDIRVEAVGGSKYSSKYPFSCLLECGICGHKLRRQIRTVGTGEKVAYWCCSNRVLNKRISCDSHHVREDVLEATYLAALRTVMESASDVTDAIRSGADAALAVENREKLDAIEEEIIALQEVVLDLHKRKQRKEVTQEEYTARIREYSDAMKEKEQLRDELQDESVKYTEIRTWLEAFDANIKNGKLLTAKDSAIMRTIVERIVVKDDGIEIYLKCGVCVGQEFVR